MNKGIVIAKEEKGRAFSHRNKCIKEDKINTDPSWNLSDGHINNLATLHSYWTLFALHLNTAKLNQGKAHFPPSHTKILARTIVLNFDQKQSY